MPKKLVKLCSRNSIQIGILLIIVAILFVLCVPKVSHTLFPQFGNNEWKQFETQILSNKKINSQDYWKFREFYSPGAFMTNELGFSKKFINQFVERHALPVNQDSIPYVFAQFTSPRLSSIDALTSAKSISEIVHTKSIPKSKIISESPTYLLFRTTPNKFFLIALFNPDQTKKANGLLDYQKDRKLINGKNWVTIAEITTSN